MPTNPGIIGGARRLDEVSAQKKEDGKPGAAFWNEGCEMGTVSKGVKITQPNVPDVNRMAKKKGKK